MNPLKFWAILLLFMVISACSSDSLEMSDVSEINKKSKEKIQTSEIQEENDDDGCETAFAKFHKFCDWKGYVFASHPRSNPDGYPSLNLTQNRWGWATNITADLTETFDLWSGAAKNDINKGNLVGNVKFSYKNSKLIVTYTVSKEYILKELHIYANDKKPTTIAPGQYGYTMEFDHGITTHTAEFDLTDTDKDGLWVIAHAVVCPCD